VHRSAHAHARTRDSVGQRPDRVQSSSVRRFRARARASRASGISGLIGSAGRVGEFIFRQVREDVQSRLPCARKQECRRDWCARVSKRVACVRAKSECACNYAHLKLCKCACKLNEFLCTRACSSGRASSANECTRACSCDRRARAQVRVHRVCAQGMSVHVQLCACKLCKCVCKMYDLCARARAIAGAQALQVSARKSAVVIGVRRRNCITV
jgi:hypothetical protein